MLIFLLLTALMGVAASLFCWPALVRRTPADAASGTSGPPEPPQRVLATALTLGLWLGTAGLYVLIGAPQTVTAEAPAPDAATQVAQLQAHLQTQPDDAPGWRQLARVQAGQGQFAAAVAAHQRLFSLQSPDADMLTDYALALGMAASPQTLSGEPEAALNAALQLDPRHAQALALSGRAALERQDYARAIAQWQRLLDVLPAADPQRASIETQLAQAQALAQHEGVRSGGWTGR